MELVNSTSAVLLPEINTTWLYSLSRCFSQDHEWELHDSVIQTIFHLWGSPSCDFFASCKKKKCLKYCSGRGRGEGLGSELHGRCASGSLVRTTNVRLSSISSGLEVTRESSRARCDQHDPTPKWPRAILVS